MKIVVLKCMRINLLKYKIKYLNYRRNVKMIGKKILVYPNGKGDYYREARIINETKDEYTIVWCDTETYAGEVSKEFLNKFDAPYYWVFV